VTGDPDDELTLDAYAKLLRQDRVTIQALDPETRAVIGTLTLTVTARDPDGLPVAVTTEKDYG